MDGNTRSVILRTNPPTFPTDGSYRYVDIVTHYGHIRCQRFFWLPPFEEAARAEHKDQTVGASSVLLRRLLPALFAFITDKEVIIVSMGDGSVVHGSPPHRARDDRPNGRVDILPYERENDVHQIVLHAGFAKYSRLAQCSVKLARDVSADRGRFCLFSRQGSLTG